MFITYFKSKGRETNTVSLPLFYQFSILYYYCLNFHVSTSDIEIREHITYYLNLPNKEEKMKYKAQLHELYSISNPKRAILDNAFKKCIALMMAEMVNIEQSVTQLEEQN